MFDALFLAIDCNPYASINELFDKLKYLKLLFNLTVTNHWQVNWVLIVNTCKLHGLTCVNARINLKNDMPVTLFDESGHLTGSGKPFHVVLVKTFA